MRIVTLVVLIAICFFGHIACAIAQDAVTADNVSLSDEQARLADRYERLEQVMTQLAELSASTDPNRAKLLREALALARERDVTVRFNAAVGLLDDGRLATAVQNQSGLQKDLQELLDLLLTENRGDELARQKAWLRKQLKEVGRIIRLQRGVKARTEGGDEAKRLADDQQNITDRTGELGDAIEAAEGDRKSGSNGKPTGGEPGQNDQPEDDQDEGSDENGKRSEENGGKSPSDQGREPADGDASGEGKSGEGQPGKGQPGKGQPGKGQSGEGQSGEGQSGEGQSGEGQSGEGQSGEGQSGEGQSGEGQSGEGQSGESQSGDGQSGEGPSGEGDSPPQSEYESLRRRIRAAQQNMDRAQKQLEEAKREGAIEEQDKALRELEAAKAELERILRQLREEEMEQTLVLLEARLRKMLDMQLEVYEGTVRLGKVSQKNRNHDDEIEAGRLSRQESAIVHVADKALSLLYEEGTSVAFPEAIEQARNDMQDIAVRLGRVKVGAVTQGLEEDVIEALEEAIAAVQKAMADLEQNRTPPGEGPPPGEPTDPSLVDQIAELKMIRSLQARTKRRTERYAEMIEGAQAEQPDLVAALARLAERQRRIEQATHDLDTRRNR